MDHATAKTARRWTGVGRSDLADSRRAAREAATSALAGREPRLVVVFASPRHDLHVLAEEIDELAAGAPSIGCSTAGEIATGGPGDAGVVVFALGGPGFSVRTAAAEGLSMRLREAGAEVAMCAHSDDAYPHRVLLLLTDALAGDQQEIIRGAYATLGAGVPLVGGCAGDDLLMAETHQIHRGRVLRDAVVAAAIASEAPIGIGVRHGWRPVGDAMLVSRAERNVVIELDERPALDVYLERLGAPEEARTDPAAFTRFALQRPLGLAHRSGEPHVRFIGGADFASRSLNCIAAVPEGASAWVMEGDERSVLDATDAACADALAGAGGAAVGLLAFDCIARRGVLGDEGIHREVARVARHAGGAPVAGFYTYGEIARTRGLSGFHNETLVVLALGA